MGAPSEAPLELVQISPCSQSACELVASALRQTAACHQQKQLQHNRTKLLGQILQYVCIQQQTQITASAMLEIPAMAPCLLLQFTCLMLLTAAAAIPAHVCCCSVCTWLWIIQQPDVPTLAAEPDPQLWQR